MLNLGYYNDAVFPWYESTDDRKFKRILLRTIIVCLILSAIVPFLPVPEVEKKQLSQVSPRLAKLIVKKKEEKKPPPKKIVKKKEDKPKSEKKKAKKQVKKEVKKKIEQSGLLAFSDDLADLRESFDLGKIDKTKTVKQNVKQYNASKLISKSADKLSGGVDKSRLTVATVDQKLEGHSTSAVSSNISVAKAERINRATGKAGRTREEIESIFQKYKGAFYSMYNRTLRTDPTIQGRVTIELTISPSGRVTSAKIISSALGNKQLERKIIARVKLMKFAAKNVDFFPS